MRNTILTYTVKPRREEENAGLVRPVLEELARLGRPDCATRSSIFRTRASSFTCTRMRAAQPVCRGWSRSKPS
jgi:hypothetical protein